ncbi:MAG: hypothetical protein Q8O53_02525 [Candidatus Moranbacteria bacterium]|nr:hypothetical protein [Candidatus Moranbacteria bacterium]
MNISQCLFLQVITWECQRESTVFPPQAGCKAVLQSNSEEALRSMVEVRVREGRFDPKEYSDNARRAIETSLNGATALAILSEYCYFQSAVQVLPSLPNLIARLRHHGLTEWAELQTDRETLRPLISLALQIIDNAAALRGDFPPHIAVQVARLVQEISDLFGIVPSVRTQELAAWHQNRPTQMH